LGQNLFFSGRKEFNCFAPESVHSSQKAPDSILNRREHLQKAITALGQRGEQSLRFLERFGERRRQKKEKSKTGCNSYSLVDFFFLFFIDFICDFFSSMEE
jgi:hypothetical protein